MLNYVLCQRGVRHSSLSTNQPNNCLCTIVKRHTEKIKSHSLQHVTHQQRNLRLKCRMFSLRLLTAMKGDASRLADLNRHYDGVTGPVGNIWGLTRKARLNVHFLTKSHRICLRCYVSMSFLLFREHSVSEWPFFYRRSFMQIFVCKLTHDK